MYRLISETGQRGDSPFGAILIDPSKGAPAVSSTEIFLEADTAVL